MLKNQSTSHCGKIRMCQESHKRDEVRKAKDRRKRGRGTENPGFLKDQVCDIEINGSAEVAAKATMTQELKC